VALLHALRYEHEIVNFRAHGMSRQELSARAGQIAEGTWAPAPTGQAIGEMIAAIVAATSAAAAAGSVTWD
jgi:hypothetical protein